MFKFRETIKIDPYSGASIDVLVDHDDRLSVRATDLIGDAWHDFLDALVRVEQFELQGRMHDRNREVQTCLTKLMTHLDGVVCGMCKCLEDTRADFTPPKYGKYNDCTLEQKIKYLIDYVHRVHHIVLPPLRRDFKVLRDLLIHPYANKSINQGDIFDVSLDDLKATRAEVDTWLGEVTELFEYPRGYHTARLAEDYSKKVIDAYKRHGGTLPPQSEMKFRIYRI